MFKEGEMGRPGTDQHEVILYTIYRLDSDTVSYLQLVELRYIYQFVARTLGTDDPALIKLGIKNIPVKFKGRSKVEHVHRVYEWCKTQELRVSGRYDTRTAALPPRHTRNFSDY